MVPAVWGVALLPRSIVVVAFAQMLASASPGAARLSPRDSLRLEHRAHDAQAEFEMVHRDYLPEGYGGVGGGEFCDARVGRFCYWSDDGDSSVPAESPRVVRARTRLLFTLDSIATILPGDDWIAGQRVRYRLDAGDTAEAVSTARSCGATGWWCAALAGLAMHEAGEVAPADSAFDAALAAMPERERCHWTDISPLLDGALADHYHRLGCAARDSLAERIWWISAPLYLVGRDDFRAEILSRETRARIEERARSPQMIWGDDVRELMIRYGWSTWYSRIMPGIGSAAEPSIIGHDPSPSFAFLPEGIAVDSPFTLRPDEFDLQARDARARYAPRYLRILHALRHQIAFFRRGDSALVVAALDVHDDSTLAGHPHSTGLFLWTDPYRQTAAIHDESPDADVLTATAPWHPLVIGLEVLARDERSAARARVGRRLPPRTAGISLSDLLLYAPGKSTPHMISDVLPHVLPTDRIHRREPLGLYWETYGLDPRGETVSVSVTIARTDDGLLHRAAQVLRVAGRDTPLTVRWREVPESGTGIAARAVAVDLSRLPTGHYVVSIAEAADGRVPITVSRPIDIVR